MLQVAGQCKTCKGGKGNCKGTKATLAEALKAARARFGKLKLASKCKACMAGCGSGNGNGYGLGIGPAIARGSTTPTPRVRASMTPAETDTSGKLARLPSQINPTGKMLTSHHRRPGRAGQGRRPPSVPYYEVVNDYSKVGRRGALERGSAARLQGPGATVLQVPPAGSQVQMRGDSPVSEAAIPTPQEAAQQAARFRRLVADLTAEVGRVIVGMDEVVENTLIALLAGGHVLLEGVPGLGKTLLVRTLSDALDLKFTRIQFTPDLMPADIIGTTVLWETPTGEREFQFQPGPIFANVILADEINRATPKTQSALLEAMQEHSVTVAGTTRHARRAVLRLGHAEPHRDGRHLSAARGPARPLPVQARGGLPLAGRTARDHEPHHRARRRARTRRWPAGGDPRARRGRAPGPGRRARAGLRAAPGARHAPRQRALHRRRHAASCATAPAPAARRR